ncbi:MAG: NAD(P)/FAD-dependent oxidoreductase [Candidatus Lokiarchaeota archaeon]|nr:NAD(P)/FAD-dependent oxidoreductase [Candidatus Lokiarchaeota archaeon]
MTTTSHEFIIVGAGMAGLTATAYLSRAGHDVLLIEKNETCGGLLGSIQKDGFVFDTGPRSIENSGAVRPLLNDLEISLELLKSPVSIGIEDKILHFTSNESIYEYQSLLEKLYPDNKEEIAAIFLLIKNILKDMVILNEIDNPIFKDMKKDIGYLFKELFPYLGKFLLANRRINRRKDPVEDTLKKMTSNQSLVDIMTQHFFKSTPTFFALGYFHTYLDYFYPKGGTRKIPEAIVQKIINWGGSILYGTEIHEIIPSENKLADIDGNTFSYEKLIWCADLKSLYRFLKFRDLEEKVSRKISIQKDKLLSNRGGDSVFSLFLGIDEPLEKFQSISNGHFFYTPSKKGLGESTWTTLKTIIKNFETTPKEAIMNWLDEYCQLNTYEISIPGLRDPTLSPKEKTGLIVSILFEYDLMKKVQEGGWYEEFKIEVENRMVEILSKSVYPRIKDKILFRFSLTPISISNRVGSSEGAITGWTFENPIPVVQDILNMTKSVKTPIPNILQAGQWSYSPSGVPIAILTGLAAAKNVMKNKK